MFHLLNTTAALLPFGDIKTIERLLSTANFFDSMIDNQGLPKSNVLRLNY